MASEDIALRVATEIFAKSMAEHKGALSTEDMGSKAQAAIRAGRTFEAVWNGAPGAVQEYRPPPVPTTGQAMNQSTGALGTRPSPRAQVFDESTMCGDTATESGNRCHLMAGHAGMHMKPKPDNSGPEERW